MKRVLGEVATLARFGSVGGAATLIHVLVAGIVLWIWPSASPFLANLVAFLAAFQVSLWGHRHFTFRRTGRGERFFVLALAGFALNNGVLGALLAATAIDGFIAIVLATFTVPLLMYLAARFWAFA